VGQDGEEYRSDLGFGKTEIFLQTGLDRAANQLETVQQIRRFTDRGSGDPGCPLRVRGGGGLSFVILGQTSRDMGNAISGQHLGFFGLVSAFALLDLLSSALFRSFAIFGSDRIRVDQLLSKGRFTKNQCSNKSQVPK
jgi:hypothetical protein